MSETSPITTSRNIGLVVITFLSNAVRGKVPHFPVRTS
jgi:hypothetical protein